jgi:hypothetical protein
MFAVTRVAEEMEANDMREEEKKGSEMGLRDVDSILVPSCSCYHPCLP